MQKFEFLLACVAAVGVFAQRQVEPVAAFEYGLRVSELAEPPFAMVCTHTRVACAVERDAFDHHVDADFVDASTAELLGAHYGVRPSRVRCEDVEGKSVLARSDCPEDLIDFAVSVRNDRQQRIEELVGDNRLVDADRIDDRGVEFLLRFIALPAKNNSVFVQLCLVGAFPVSGRGDEFRVLRVV